MIEGNTPRAAQNASEKLCSDENARDIIITMKRFEFPATFPLNVLLLGSGELGKELTISLQRLGCHVTACDSYPEAPAMQVANAARVLNMADSAALTELIEQLEPDLIVPEVEKLAADALVRAAQQGYNVVPSARTVELTFDRQGIRSLAADVAQVPTSPYAFAASFEQLQEAAAAVGYPCYVKPTMSSSGHGQSRVTAPDQLRAAWKEAASGARADTGRVIVEGEIAFDYEITLLTLRHLVGGEVHTSFCAPIGHRQQSGDYVESWQPQPMDPAVLTRAQEIAKAVTDALAQDTAAQTGTADADYPVLGIFGVELFVQGADVYFSELSPRPHDTGMVTMISQQFSEFDLHARAILGLPAELSMHVPAAASAPYKSQVAGENLRFERVAEALAEPGTELRIFGKPTAHIGRRLAVALAARDSVPEARAAAQAAVSELVVHTA